MIKMSTGADSTLGNWLKMTTAFFGVDSEAVKFLQDKINMSTLGENEEVIADEGQFINLLGQIHLGPD